MYSSYDKTPQNYRSSLELDMTTLTCSENNGVAQVNVGYPFVFWAIELLLLGEILVMVMTTKTMQIP
jgi:hypothetical protein